MSYIKQNFIDGEILKADQLNEIEDQIILNESLIANKADKNHTHDGIASEIWVTQQIQTAINATWEASY